MDVKDYKILDILVDNCRTSYTQIGKKVGLSKENVFQRIKRMEKNNVIREYLITVDLDALNFIHHVCFLQVTSKNEKLIIEYLKNVDNFGWIGINTGKYSIVFDVVTKNKTHADELLLNIYNKFPSDLGDYLFLQVNNQRNVKETPKVDLKILSLLNQNPKITYTELHNKTNLSIPTIKSRMKQLEKVISSFTVNYNYKIHKNLWHGIQIKIKRLGTSTETKLETYFKTVKEIHYFYKYYKNGIYDYDVGVLVDNDKELKSIIDELKHQFHEYIDIKNSFLTLEELTSEKVPQAVFNEAL